MAEPIIKQKLIRVMRFCADARWFSFMLLWLMFLLFLGTFSQKYIGLYQAHQLYFDAYIWWLGGAFPLPATRSILVLMAVCLLCKVLLERWTLKRVGSLVLHLGALLMLFGGFLSGMFASEGNVVLKEGGRANYSVDYYDVELAVSLGNRDVAVFAQEQLRSGRILEAAPLPFSFLIEDFYKNVALTPREALLQETGKGEAVRGMRQAVHIAGKAGFKEEEANISGLKFSLIPRKGEVVEDAPYGAYALIENAPVQQTLNVGEAQYVVEVRHKRKPLPFSLELVDFRKVNYAGTNKAKSYESDVILIDGDVHWRSTIRMNEPLRYKGYTFFQSSFLTNEEGQELSVLAAVHNVGRLFPYISTILMCLGLLVHLFMRLKGNKAKKGEVG